MFLQVSFLSDIKRGTGLEYHKCPRKANVIQKHKTTPGHTNQDHIYSPGRNARHPSGPPMNFTASWWYPATDGLGTGSHNQKSGGGNTLHQKTGYTTKPYRSVSHTTHSWDDKGGSDKDSSPLHNQYPIHIPQLTASPQNQSIQEKSQGHQSPLGYQSPLGEKN